MKESLSLEKLLNDGRIKARIEQGFRVTNFFSEDQEIKLSVICPSGHSYTVSKWRFSKGVGCGICKGKNKTHIFETFKKSAEQEGWQVLETEYQDQNKRIKMMSPDGVIKNVSMLSWKRGIRKETKPRKMIKNRSIKDLKLEFSKEGYSLLESSYVSSTTKMSVRCPKGHIFKVHWNHWKSSGVRCSYCFGTPKVSEIDIQNHLETIKAGYKLIRREKYGSRLYCVFLCDKGHEWSVSLSDFFTKKYRCSHCKPKSSKAELNLLEEIKKHYPNAKKYKELGFEIDIFIPEINLGIEYCGLYWHSEKYKPKNFHFDKWKKSLSAGVKLLTIFEDEWIKNKDLVLRRIIRLNKINANKTEFRSITKKEANSFFEKNHLQGKAPKNTTHCFGLFHKEELVAAISYGPHHRNKENCIVLNRLCFGMYDIAGGSEKLFKNSLSHLPQKTIITWSDNRYSLGKVYERLGFTKDEMNPPDYYYCKPGYPPLRVSKQSLKKTKEEKLTNKTERELRKEQGWVRIYDCGKIRWVFNRD